MSATVIPARTVIVTVEDSTIDLVCFEVAFAALGDRAQAGRLPGYVQATLDANPGLAHHVLLPVNTRIALPEYAVAEPGVLGVRLWD